MAIHFFSIQCQARVPSSHWSFRKCCGENVKGEGALIGEVSGMVLYRRRGWQLWGYLEEAKNVFGMLIDIQFSHHPVKHYDILTECVCMCCSMC